MSVTTRSPRFLPSPSSPSGSHPKFRPESSNTFPAPHSPVSPLMSVATKSYVSTYGKNQHTDEMAQRPPPSPPESYTQSNQKLNTYQEGSLKRSNPDDDGQHRDKRQKTDISQSDRMDVDTNIAPTNHDRQGDLTEAAGPSGLGEQTSSISDEFAEPFLLCKSSVPRSHPDPQTHLLATYGLLPLLKTVARNDPQTGEKINKLRKSYEGQIKMFGLAGRNKPVKCDREEEDPGPLRLLATVSEEEWNQGAGRSKIEITGDFRARLEKAVQLQPGTVRKNDMWEDLLGHEKTKPIIMSSVSQPVQPQYQSRLPNGGSKYPQPAGTAVDKRSTRGKKRSYGDDSFSGYGEGYSEGDDDGDDDESTRRKRKKDTFGPPSYHNGR